MSGFIAIFMLIIVSLILHIIKHSFIDLILFSALVNKLIMFEYMAVL